MSAVIKAVVDGLLMVITAILKEIENNTDKNNE